MRSSSARRRFKANEEHLHRHLRLRLPQHFCSHKLIRITLVPLGRSLCKIITIVGVCSFPVIDRTQRGSLSVVCVSSKRCNRHICPSVAFVYPDPSSQINKQILRNGDGRFIKRRPALEDDCTDAEGHQIGAVLMRRYLNCIDTVPEYTYRMCTGPVPADADADANDEMR